MIEDKFLIPEWGNEWLYSKFIELIELCVLSPLLPGFLGSLFAIIRTIYGVRKYIAVIASKIWNF